MPPQSYALNVILTGSSALGAAAGTQTGTPFQFQMGGSQPNTGGQPNTGASSIFSAGTQGHSTGIAGQQQQQQQQSGMPPMFHFGASPGGGTTQGYNFTIGSGPNLNFGSQTAPNTAFSASSNTAAAPAPDVSRRIIKKATRRKKT